MTRAIRVAAVLICGFMVSGVSLGQTQVFTLGPYGYDGAGNIMAIGTNSFTYDQFGRITWGTAGTGRNERYTYDRWGNLLTITTDDATSPRVTIGVNPATNRASESTDGANAFASYDPDTGQITSYTGGSFTYDAAGMVKQSTIDGVTRVHLYSPSDERIASIVINQNVETSSEWSFRDTGGRVLRRASRAGGNDNNWTWQEDYIYRDGQLLAAEVPSSAGTLHFHLDHLGTPRLITDRGGLEVSRHTYYPFGMEATPRSTAQRMKFTGHERDFAAGAGSDMDYMHARLFRTAWGRFLSVDPVLDIRKSLKEPQRWNRYTYVQNNPLRFIDPTGREGEDKTQNVEPQPHPVGPNGELLPPPVPLPPGKNGQPNEWVPVVNPDPRPGQRPVKWKPRHSVPSPTGAQPSGSWDPEGHYDVDIPATTGGPGDRVRVLPDGTRLGPDHKPLPNQFSIARLHRDIPAYTTFAIGAYVAYVTYVWDQMLDELRSCSCAAKK